MENNAWNNQHPEKQKTISNNAVAKYRKQLRPCPFHDREHNNVQGKSKKSGNVLCTSKTSLQPPLSEVHW
jgi:hypothetical protein